MRFPYGIVCALFAMPEAADLDTTLGRRISTFRQAAMLLGTISGRQDYSSPGEKFEDVTMLLFSPLREGAEEPWIKLYGASTGQPLHELPEEGYFLRLRDIYNVRNPHSQIGIQELNAEGEDER